MVAGIFSFYNKTMAPRESALSGNIIIQIKSVRENRGNITLVDESLQGKNITLAASHDIDLGAATNTKII